MTVVVAVVAVVAVVVAVEQLCRRTFHYYCCAEYRRCPLSFYALVAVG
jgi:hypothetical protein